jgi:hypothetical protein
MARTKDAPSHSRFSHFRCEEATVVDVNRKTYCVKVETRHTSKSIEDIQALAPYHHFANGEGIHHLPEVGAVCLVAFPSDDTPPFIMGYKGSAAVLISEDDTPERSTSAAEGSMTDVSWRSRRPKLNPGDIAITTRDENFIFLRRGGIVQIGSTPISQRVYIPILNYIKDFAENYAMQTFGGDVSWTVGRVEDDPGGNAPATYVFHMNEFAQDAKATVRVRHLPLSNGDKAAWEVHVAPQGISREDGSVENEVYSMIIMTDGEKTEIIGANRNVTVKGNDTLTVEGDRRVDVSGTHKLSGSSIELTADQQAALIGSIVKLASSGASSPAVLGDQLIQWFGTAQWVVAGTVATVSPAAITALAQILSQKVLLE